MQISPPNVINQRCEACNTAVAVYPERPGGFLNWERHQASRKHLRRTEKERLRSDTVDKIQTQYTSIQPSHDPEQAQLEPRPKHEVSSQESPSQTRCIQRFSEPQRNLMNNSNAYSGSGLQQALVRGELNVNELSLQCQGVPLPINERQNIYADYPWALHADFTLDWMPELINGKLSLRSAYCEREVRPRLFPTCDICLLLLSEPAVIKMRERAASGCKENTAHSYLTITQLRRRLQDRAAQVNSLKLNALNYGRTIASKARQLDDFSRFLMAVSSGKIERISSLVSVSLNNGVGIQGILEKIERAINHLYTPRGYNQRDFDKSILALRLGGTQLLNLLHKSAGFPHRRSVQRHSVVPQLLSSATAPLEGKIQKNLEATFPRTLQTKRVAVNIMVDEIAIKKALRLDVCRNLILGLCREHTSEHCSVEFTTYQEALAILNALKEDRIHLASEATVVALGAFSESPEISSMRPITISGSCKHENSSTHGKILSRVLQVCRRSPNIRVYCFSTDGESRRRLAIAGLTLTQQVTPDTPLYTLLGHLPLFNLLCGEDFITACSDKKHNDKRCRNTLLRSSGTVVQGVHITSDVIEQHLTHVTPSTSVSLAEPAVLSLSAASACLNPDDKQNVTLAFRLLSAIARLRQPLPCDSPAFALKRRILNLMGTMYCYLLDPITNTYLSLREQLEQLSAAVHIVLALYAQNKGAFMPTQLYYDIQTYIKCAYFSVAKTKLDDPEGKFFITLLGTDRLETGFGHVRTMIGNDSNVDQLQLTSRLSAITECSTILESHTEWSTTPDRLKYTGLRSLLGNTSRSIDHLGPSSWVGDVYVSNVNLQTAWQAGRRLAEATLQLAGVPLPFENMIASGGFDILSPFGKNCVILTNGLFEGEEDEGCNQSYPNETVPSPNASVYDTAEDLQPDLEDHAMSEMQRLSNSLPSNTATHVLVDGVYVDKRSILKSFSDPFSTITSTDRLKRVRSLPKFDTIASTVFQPIHSSDFGSPGIVRDDPAVTLVRCRNMVFLAVVQISGITWEGERVFKLPLDSQSSDVARIQCQVMTLSPVVQAAAASQYWQWTQEYERLGVIPSLDVPGQYIQPINPIIERFEGGAQTEVGSPVTVTSSARYNSTYIFHNEELQAIAADLFQRLSSELPKLSEIKLSETFPYRSLEGKLCFLCEPETGARIVSSDQRCSRCPNVLIKTGPKLLLHNAAHVLGDKDLARRSPCGFCLRTDGECVIFLHLKGTKGIDFSRSTCPNLTKIQLTKAGKYSKSSPCTNIPVICPHCPAGTPSIWRYNLKQHLEHRHPNQPLEPHQNLWEISEEEDSKVRKLSGIKRRRRRGEEIPEHMKISEEHLSSTLSSINTDANSQSTIAVRYPARKRQKTVKAQESTELIECEEGSDSDEDYEEIEGEGLEVQIPQLDIDSNMLVRVPC